MPPDAVTFPPSLSAADFFPRADAETWVFQRPMTNDRVEVRYSARTVEGRREVRLDPAGSDRLLAVFDRLTAGPRGLELNRFTSTSGLAVVEHTPGCLLTLGPEPNRHDAFFPKEWAQGVPCPLETTRKVAEVVAQGGHMTYQWRIELVAKNVHGVLMTVRLVLLGGAGIVEAMTKVGGSFYLYQRQPAPGPGPVPPDLPHYWIEPRSMLRLTDGARWVFKNRSTGQRVALTCAPAGNVYSYGGEPELLLRAVVADDKGVAVSRLRLRGQDVALPAPWSIGGPRIDLLANPVFTTSFGLPVSPGAGPSAPATLRARWHLERSTLPWPDSPGGSFNFAVRYLHLDVRPQPLLSPPSAPPPPALFEQVLALSDRTGPVRISTRQGGGPPVFWDLHEYPVPLPPG
jgi:hypothetical protein